MDNFEYKNMLLELDKSLKSEEFESLKFMCKDDIKKRERENVKRPVDLWEHLETREKLSPTKLDYLKNLIRSSCNGRLDVMRIIEAYENRTPSVNQTVNNSIRQPMEHQVYQPVMPVVQPIPVPSRNPATSAFADCYRREINFLTKNLGKEWRFFMRTLGITDSDILSVEQDYPRSLRDQIYQCMVQWITENNGQFNRAQVIAAFKDSSVERFDLAARLEENDY